jgi:hypothetical protein
VQAGILEAPVGSPDLTRAILADQSISEEQKQALVRIYLSFRREYEDEHGRGGSVRGGAKATGGGGAEHAGHDQSDRAGSPGTPDAVATG